MAGPQDMRNEGMAEAAASRAAEMDRLTQESISKMSKRVRVPTMISEEEATATNPGAGSPQATATVDPRSFLEDAKKAAGQFSVPHNLQTAPAQAKQPATTEQMVSQLGALLQQAQTPLLDEIRNLRAKRDEAELDLASDEDDECAKKAVRAVEGRIGKLEKQLTQATQAYNEAVQRGNAVEQKRFEQDERTRIVELSKAVAAKFPKGTDGRPLVSARELKDAFYDMIESNPALADYQTTPSLIVLARDKMPELAYELFEPLANLAAPVASPQPGPVTATTQIAQAAASAPASVPSAATAAPHAAQAPTEIDLVSAGGPEEALEQLKKAFTAAVSK